MSDFAVLKGIRPRHYVNGIDKKLSRDPCFLFVLAEAEQAQAGYNYQGRIRIAQFGGIGCRPLLMILLVSGPVLANLALDALFKSVHTAVRSIPGQEPGADPRAQEMVRATGAQRT